MDKETEASNNHEQGFAALHPSAKAQMAVS